MYRVLSSDPEDMQLEINKILEFVKERLDSLEGIKGSALVRSSQVTQGDLVVDASGTGVVLMDDADPPGYWRVSIDSTGTLTQTSLGREYD